jgi:hypothetical protein
MDQVKNHPLSGWLFPVVMFAGITARMLVAALGHNFDMDSWRIVAGIMDHGGNVYASTDRYNYGPVWFNVLHALNLLAGRNPVVFRCLVVFILSLADVGIFFILWRKFGKLAATLFFLNPVSIMITGFHNQFDNLAILLGLCSVLLFGDEFEKPPGRRQFWGLLVLGISLMTKHLLFAFPLWLAVKQRGLLQKFSILAVPIAVFFAGFLPYWSAGHAGIIQHVFEYQSSSGMSGYNRYFYNLFVPEILKFFVGPTACWLACLILGAFISRRINSLDSLLVYTGLLVLASPATANQYLAIPIVLVSVRVNLFSVCYTAFAAAHLAVYATGPRLVKNYTGRFDDIAILFLFLTLVWLLWREPLLRLLRRCRAEIHLQCDLSR